MTLSFSCVVNKHAHFGELQNKLLLQAPLKNKKQKTTPKYCWGIKIQTAQFWDTWVALVIQYDFGETQKADVSFLVDNIFLPKLTTGDIYLFLESCG